MLIAEDETVLIYEYINEPHGDAVETLQMRYGTARLVVTGDDQLEGHYHTGRGRMSVVSSSAEMAEVLPVCLELTKAAPPSRPDAGCGGQSLTVFSALGKIK